jgi:hypothetical protein
MERNIGMLDGRVRLAVGALLAVVGIAAVADVLEVGLTAGVVALVVGAVLVGTSVTGLCPLYRALGISTADE